MEWTCVQCGKTVGSIKYDGRVVPASLYWLDEYERKGDGAKVVEAYCDAYCSLFFNEKKRDREGTFTSERRTVINENTIKVETKTSKERSV
jgi:hypothetical protein|tara:strand:- start:1389 stop:1661 length:273 start_codon:yes stop_codon:yes gene_type:complete